jgi:hypothetical protein
LTGSFLRRVANSGSFRPSRHNSGPRSARPARAKLHELSPGHTTVFRLATTLSSQV